MPFTNRSLDGPPTDLANRNRSHAVCVHIASVHTVGGFEIRTKSKLSDCLREPDFEANTINLIRLSARSGSESQLICLDRVRLRRWQCTPVAFHQKVSTNFSVQAKKVACTETMALLRTVQTGQRKKQTGQSREIRSEEHPLTCAHEDGHHPQQIGIGGLRILQKMCDPYCHIL